MAIGAARGEMRNILLLSAGRRVSLLRGFQSAARNLGGIKCFAADAAPAMSAACRIAEKSFTLPRVNEEGYIDALLALCSKEDIGLVIPTIDPELPVLAESKDAAHARGVAIAVSSSELIDLFGDKRSTASFFEQRDLPTPRLFRRDAIEFPVFVKPYDGSLSKGAMMVPDKAHLTRAILDNPKNIFCEYIDPNLHAEYTCDLYFDRKHRLKCAVPRRRLEVRGGEVSKALATRVNLEAFFFERLGSLPGATGVLTIQVFRHETTGALKFNEVNARFGGGYPLTRHVGGDYQDWLMREYLLGEEIEQTRDWAEGVTMLRFDDEVIVRPGP